ncbi:MAG: right-handed parallel beta-helix repeat-containing protein [Chthonomonadales bacterium]|nr:right-handed parallel beta-helix repeat-containing protein [Chthonomonadales bacterium]
MPAPALLLAAALLLALCAPARAEERPVHAEVASVVELRAALARLAPSAGGAIHLAPGTYELDSPLEVRGCSLVGLVGAGAGRTTLRRRGDGDAIVFRGACNNCSVRGLRVVGDPRATRGSGVVFTDTDWSGLSSIDSCTIEGFAEYGVSFAGRYAAPESSNTVSNCLLRNNRRAQIGSVANNDFFFVRNHMVVDAPAASAACGIAMARSSAGSVAHNVFRGCWIGVRMAGGCSINRIEDNAFDGCHASAIDSGAETPPGYDLRSVPRARLYEAWEWDNANRFRLNAETLIRGNVIRADGEGFRALDARGTVFCTFHGNTLITPGRVGGVLRAGPSCMGWIVRDNLLRGEAARAWEVPGDPATIASGNATRARGAIAWRPPGYRVSDLARRLARAAGGADGAGGGWFRAVATAADLERAVRDLPAAGGTIYLAAGVYRLGGPLVLRDRRDVTLLGAGQAAVLRGPADSDLLAFRGDSRNCTVANLTLTPEGADPGRPTEGRGSAISFEGTGGGLRVEHCNIDNWPVSCVRVEGSRDRPIRDLRVLDCWIIRGRAAQLDVRGCAGLVVSGNQFGYTFPDKSPVGARFADCVDGLYELNYHWGNLRGIELTEGCRRIQIIDNRSEQSKECGLALGGREGGRPNRAIRVEGNTFHTNSEMDPGLHSNVAARNTSDVLFAANQLFTWWEPRRVRHALELGSGCNGWRVEGNYLRDHMIRAIRAAPGDDSRIRDNLVDSWRNGG